MRTLSALLITAILASCGSSRDVVGEGWLQKRKYCAGWHVDLANSDAHSARERIRVLHTRPIITAEIAQHDPLLSTGSLVWERRAKSGKRQVASNGSARLVARGSQFEADRSEEGDEQERTHWNLVAIASAVVFAIGFSIAVAMQSTELLVIASAIALALAIISAKRCRDKGERGEGFALITMGFATAALLIGIIALVGRFTQ